MKLAVLILLGAAAAAALLVMLALQLRYKITDRHLKVTLFGLCMRRVEISDIDYVSKRRANRAERWHNTLRAAHRVLVIHRRRGWFKDFVITPKNRYVCKAELDRALAKSQRADNRKPDDRGVASD